jgi:hypothetical protein
MIDYIINEEKRIVIARFAKEKGETDSDVWRQNLIRHIEKTCPTIALSVFRQFTNIVDAEVRSVESYCGISLCCGDDTFDVEFGKNLAKTRLLKRYSEVQAHCDARISNVFSEFAKIFADAKIEGRTRAMVCKATIARLKEIREHLQQMSEKIAEAS